MQLAVSPLIITSYRSLTGFAGGFRGQSSSVSNFRGPSVRISERRDHVRRSKTDQPQHRPHGRHPHDRTFNCPVRARDAIHGRDRRWTDLRPIQGPRTVGSRLSSAAVANVISRRVAAPGTMPGSTRVTASGPGLRHHLRAGRRRVLEIMWIPFYDLVNSISIEASASALARPMFPPTVTVRPILTELIFSGEFFSSCALAIAARTTSM